MNDELHDEVEEMLRDEARKARRGATPKRKIPPGYYDDKANAGSYDEDEAHGLADYMRELVEIRRLKHPHTRKKKK